MTVCHRCGAGMDRAARFCASCGAPRGAGDIAVPTRKHVVIIFVDIVDSTAIAEGLDPETVRRYLHEYFELVSAVLWEYGGTVEKFVGDAVMAVFGVPLAHTDGARRALIAARELHRRLAVLSESVARRFGPTLRIRIGINAGEVFVTRHADGQFSVTGDVVNVAARLQQCAVPGETALGRLVAELAGPGAPVFHDRDVLAKGKSLPLEVWKLDPDRPFTEHDPLTRLIGREEEMADLLRFARRSLRRHEFGLLTVLGPIGIGKTRLVQEMLAELPDVQVLRTSCSTFGIGGSFGPLIAVWEQLDGGDWRNQVQLLLGDQPDAALVIERLSSAVGSSSAATSLDDIEWAVRRVFTALAETRPLVVVWEDVHAAEQNFLELLGQLNRRMRGAPVLMVGVARPELWDAAPDWGGGTRNTLILELDGLDEASARELIEEVVSDDDLVAHGLSTAEAAPAGPAKDEFTRRVQRILTMSDGNPLVMTQLVEQPELDNGLPVRVVTMFDARLDRLDHPDRELCQRASVVGREFWLDAIAGQHSYQQLDRLHRLGVLEPVAHPAAGRPTHRFLHTLMVDSAYRAIPKTQRSQWHAETADWIAEYLDLAEGIRKELVAFHLERSYALLAEVDPIAVSDGVLAGRTAQACAIAGAVALDRGDLAGATRLYLASEALLPTAAPRPYPLVRRLFWCLVARQDLAAAEQLLGRVEASSASDRWWPVVIGVAQAHLGLYLSRTSPQKAQLIGDQTLRRLQAGGPDVPADLLLWTHELLATASAMQLQLAGAEVQTRAAIAAARSAGDPWSERRLSGGLCETAFWGLTKVPEALELCRQTLAQVQGDLRSSVPVLAIQAALTALAGDAERASELESRVHDIIGDLHLADLLPAVRLYLGLTASWTGRPGHAVTELLTACQEVGGPHTPIGATVQLMAARVHWQAGDPTAAVALLGWQDEIGAAQFGEDPHFYSLWSGLAAKVGATRGDDRAVDWANAAVDTAQRCDDLRGAATAWFDLADVRATRGEPAEADAARAQASRLLIAKGIDPSLARGIGEPR